jgi:hypothetical protein
MKSLPIKVLKAKDNKVTFLGVQILLCLLISDTIIIKSLDNQVIYDNWCNNLENKGKIKISISK